MVMYDNIKQRILMTITLSKKECLAFTVNLVLALLVLGGAFYLYYLYPVGYVYFITEDSLVENGSFVSWAMSFCLLVWAFWKHPGSRKAGIIFLAVVSLFIALEEISWGQRIIGYRAPRFFLVHNRQSDTTFHNFFPGFLYQHFLGVVVILVCVLPMLFTRMIPVISKWSDKLGIPIIDIRMWPFFFLASYFFIYPSLGKTSEIGELCLGIGVASISLDIAIANQGRHHITITNLLGTPVLLLVLCLLSMILTHYFNPSTGTFGKDLNKFAYDKFPRRGMYHQAEKTFDYINRNPRFLNNDTSFNHALVLMKMERRKQAREILEQLFINQEDLMQKITDDPELHRNAGLILNLLERSDEAKIQFNIAVELDRNLLEKFNDPAIEANIRWSLAKTLLAIGQIEAAFQQASHAAEVAPYARTKKKVRRWICKELKRKRSMRPE